MLALLFIRQNVYIGAHLVYNLHILYISNSGKVQQVNLVKYIYGVCSQYDIINRYRFPAILRQHGVARTGLTPVSYTHLTLPTNREV